MHSSTPVFGALPVEISGWDSDGRFFVEHCELASSERISVQLKHLVSEGALLFIHQGSQQISGGCSEPYRVLKLESCPAASSHQVYLARVRASAPVTQEAKGLSPASYKCAREVTS